MWTVVCTIIISNYKLKCHCLRRFGIENKKSISELYKLQLLTVI